MHCLMQSTTWVRPPISPPQSSGLQGGTVVQDSLALARGMGKPTFFLTLTCNPKWPDIVDSLEDGKNAFKRPDLCARLLRAKLLHIVARIKLGDILCEVNS